MSQLEHEFAVKSAFKRLEIKQEEEGENMNRYASALIIFLSILMLFWNRNLFFDIGIGKTSYRWFMYFLLLLLFCYSYVFVTSLYHHLKSKKNG